MTKQVKYIGNPVVNHKVEQIVRAILVGASLDVEFLFKSLNADVTCHTLQTEYASAHHTVLKVGTALGGYSFTPETNSALIVLGLNPSAVLFRLNQTVINGVIALADTKGELVAPFSAVLAVAYECSYSETYKLVHADYEKYKREYSVPKHFKQASYRPTKVRGTK